MPTLSSLVGGGIKGVVQRGTLSIPATSTATVTISSVNTNKAVLNWLGATSFGTGVEARIAFTNSTTITGVNNGSYPAVVSYEVMEFN